MRSAIFYLLAILPAHLLVAQGIVPNTPSYWYDDQNIRLHATYLLGNMSGDGQYGPTKWDSAQQRYVSALPGMLCYPAIAKTGYRKAIVTAIAIPSFPYYTARSAGRNAQQLALALDSLINKVHSYESFGLTYDDHGYLRTKTHKKTIAGSRYYQHDTIKYTYWHAPDGRSRINRSYSERVYYPTAGYQSAWCGTMRAPFTRISHSSTAYTLDREGLVTGIETDHNAFAGTCRDYTPDHKYLLIAYDGKGRATSIIDSSITYTGRKMLTEKRYRQLTPTDLEDSTWNYRFFRTIHLPQVSKWLATKKDIHYVEETTVQTAFTEYSNKKNIQWITGKPPKIVTTKEVVAYDGNENMLLKVENYYASEGFLLYQYGQDSAGSFKGRYGTAGIPQPDTLIYPTTIIPTNAIAYDDRPLPRQAKPDIIKTPYLDYNERNISAATNGWRIISYERELDGYNYNYNMRDEYFWAPEAGRWSSTHPPFTYFIVLGPDGLVRFVYDQGTLYKISYSR